jgi:hypothetical protein
MAWRTNMKEKKALLESTNAWLERNPAVSAGLGGLALGAGSYATVALIKEVLDLIEDRKKKHKLQHPGISSDTIVITTPKVPEKLASARDSFTVDTNKGRGHGGFKQARNEDGTFASGWELDFNACDSEEEKSASGENNSYNPTMLQDMGDIALGGALGIGGAGLGWYLMQKTYDYLKQKRLKREIAAAQQEYIDFLTYGNEKPAEVKEAQELNLKPVVQPSLAERATNAVGNFVTDKGNWSAMGGYAGTLAILLAAASTYLTKKFLDKKFEDTYDASSIPDDTKVKNIVFKTASAEKIAMTPVDAVAAIEFTSLIISAPGGVEKTAAGFYPYGVLPEDQREVAREYMKDPRGYTTMKMFEGLGMVGDDPSKWKYNTSQGGELDDLRRQALNIYENDPDGMMKVFMDPKYQKQREFMTRNALQRWYNGTGFGNTFVGKLLGAPINWLMGVVGNALANTKWGQRLMFNRIRNGAKAKADAYDKAHAQPSQVAEPPADVQNHTLMTEEQQEGKPETAKRQYTDNITVNGKPVLTYSSPAFTPTRDTHTVFGREQTPETAVDPQQEPVKPSNLAIVR